MAPMPRAATSDGGEGEGGRAAEAERAAQARSRRRMSQWAGEGAGAGIGDGFEPEREEGEGVGSLRAAEGEEGAEVLAILGAEAGGIEMEEGAIEAHQALPGAKPRARAMRTSCDMRRDSASATARPKGVMR